MRRVLLISMLCLAVSPELIRFSHFRIRGMQGLRAQTKPLVWVEASLARVSQDSEPGPNAEVNLFAARGEYESFQVVVRAPDGGLNNGNIAVSNLSWASPGPGGAPIAQSNFTLYREHYVQVSNGSEDRKGPNRPLGPGWYPDALIPFADPNGGDLSGASLRAAPFTVAAQKSQPFWVDLFVPRDSAPGLYSGTLTLSSEEGKASVPVSLTVWNFELPATPSLKSAFTIYKPLVEDAKTQAELVRHKIMPQIVNPQDEEELAGLGLNTTGLWFWSNASVHNCSMLPAPSVDTFKTAMATQAGGLPAYVYSADEVSHCSSLFPRMKEWARNLHAAGALNLVTVPPLAELQDDGSGTGRSTVDIWVLLPKQFDAYASEVATVLKKGDQIWSYTALAQDNYSPKWLIDYEPINYRIQPGFLSQTQSLSGVLYWAANYWTSSPWTNVDYRESGKSYPGEGMLVYPGGPVGIAGVVPSMRLKWIREGVEDYEYVQILKRLGRGDWALGVARTVAPDWSNWSHDAGKAEAARRQLGQEIDRLSTAAPASWVYRGKQVPARLSSAK